MVPMGSLWTVRNCIQQGDSSHNPRSILPAPNVHCATVPLKSTPMLPEGTNQQVGEELLGPDHQSQQLKARGKPQE